MRGSVIVESCLTSADYPEGATTKAAGAGEGENIFRIRPLETGCYSIPIVCGRKPTGTAERRGAES